MPKRYDYAAKKDSMGARIVASQTKAELVEENAQLRAEIDFVRKARIAEGVIQVLLAIVRFGALVLLGYWAFLAVKEIAGSSTDASIAVEFLANFNVSVTLAWAAAVGGILFGFVQRHLRRNTVERLQGRITDLETERDPNRSSSELTRRGETRPEDKL